MISFHRYVKDHVRMPEECRLWMAEAISFSAKAHGVKARCKDQSLEEGMELALRALELRCWEAYVRWG